MIDFISLLSFLYFLTLQKHNFSVLLEIVNRNPFILGDIGEE